MDPNLVSPGSFAPDTCPVCHQPVSAGQYFCSNCGAKLHEPPLSITPLAQLGLYAFSIVLPMMCFLFITRWPALKYLRSKDDKTKQVGMIACALLVLSTVVSIYYAYVWTQEAIQSQVNAINQDMSI